MQANKVAKINCELIVGRRARLSEGIECLGKGKRIRRRKLSRCDRRAVVNGQRSEMEDAVSRLPEDYRSVFLLRDVEGLSNAEIAKVLDISVPAVKSRLHRARLFLRGELSKYFARGKNVH